MYVILKCKLLTGMSKELCWETCGRAARDHHSLSVGLVAGDTTSSGKAQTSQENGLKMGTNRFYRGEGVQFSKR